MKSLGSQMKIWRSPMKNLVSDESLGVCNENLGVSKEKIGVSNEKLGVSNENLAISDEKLGVSDESLGVSNENLHRLVYIANIKCVDQKRVSKKKDYLFQVYGVVSVISGMAAIWSVTAIGKTIFQ